MKQILRFQEFLLWSDLNKALTHADLHGFLNNGCDTNSTFTAQNNISTSDISALGALVIIVLGYITSVAKIPAAFGYI